MNDSRIKQVNALIQSKLSVVIQDYIDDEIVSVTRVDTSSDLTHSKIHISVLTDNADVVTLLNRNSKDIRKELSSSLKLRATPMLHFVLDLNENYAENIDKLIKNI